MDVTIILPIYCASELSLTYLVECLYSLEGQDARVVACDDGSPLQKYVLDVLNGHKSIVDKIILSDKNYGVSHARNVCAEESKTSMIFPLDCDDTLSFGAIAKLVNAFHGVPLYSDVAKFGLVNEPWYKILDFSCENVLKYVGFTSVNVLHTREQWKSLGGWDERITFYEDGEYNARLFGYYCGEHYPEPLVNYRIHDAQRTRILGNQNEYGKKLLNQIRSYTMACPTCKKTRKTASNMVASNKSAKAVVATTSIPTKVTVGTNTLNLPLEFEGRILANYIGGKGAGKHYYKGPKSHFPYRVRFGDFLYANPLDVVGAGDASSKLIRVNAASEPVRPSLQPVRPSSQQVIATPKPESKPEPVVTDNEVMEKIHNIEKVAEELSKESIDTPDVNTMSVSKVLAMVDNPDFDCHMAAKLLQAERRGLGRIKVINFLSKRACE